MRNISIKKIIPTNYFKLKIKNFGENNFNFLGLFFLLFKFLILKKIIFLNSKLINWKKKKKKATKLIIFNYKLIVGNIFF